MFERSKVRGNELMEGIKYEGAGRQSKYDVVACVNFVFCSYCDRKCFVNSVEVRSAEQ